MSGNSETNILRVGSKNEAPIVLQTWHDFRIYYSRNLANCSYRHLYCKRNQEFLSKILEFIYEIRENPLIILDKYTIKNN